MPILIDELLVEAEPPRAAPPKGGGEGAKASPPGQADRMLELSIIADRHHRLQVD